VVWEAVAATYDDWQVAFLGGLTLTPRTKAAKLSTGASAARSFAVNQRINQLLIERLDPAVWTAKPPGKVRNVAAIFTHIHNVRVKWVRLTAPHLKPPAQLNRRVCTPEELSAALAESAACCEQMLLEAFDAAPGENAAKITHFRRDGWAQPWPVGVEMLAYMVAHEAHHRGQVCMLVHQMGFRLPAEVTAAIWDWERLKSAF
jgi:uncharacterized damage-inducible protein DinB